MVKRTFPPHLALICLASSEKTGFMDDGRRKGELTDNGRPRDDSSAVQ